jgi:stage V sporulation protein S
MSVELLKVSAWSNPKAVAGAIAGVLRERGYVDVQVIGAAALNQAVKAIAISRSYTADEGLDPICTPGFTTIDINGESRTAIRLHVEDRAGKAVKAGADPDAADADAEDSSASGE